MPLQLHIKMPGIQAGLAVQHSNMLPACIASQHRFADKQSMTKRYNIHVTAACLVMHDAEEGAVIALQLVEALLVMSEFAMILTCELFGWVKGLHVI